MKALISFMVASALIAAGTAWAGEESLATQIEKPLQSGETYPAPESGEAADPGMTGGQTGQGTEQQQTTGEGSGKKSSTEQYVDDAMITAKVKAALAKDPGTSAIRIGVETNHQTVELTGSVKSEEEKKKAESIARSVTGVKEVENKLVFEG